MKVSFRFPTPRQLDAFLEQVECSPISYREIKATQNTKFPSGYDHDRNMVYIGNSNQVWENAKNALLNWQQYPKPWTKIYPPLQTFQEGQNVAVLFRLFGLWWWNSCRIVYTINEADRYGFAYGTLAEHVEMGEEIFCIERQATGEIYYRVEAFSRPRFWLTKLAYPLARYYQKKFVRQSKTAMIKYASCTNE